MKKIYMFLIFILLFSLTGCSSYDMSMKINKNKSIDYSVTIMSNSENSEFINNMFIYKDKLDKCGYIVDEYINDNQYGVIIKKHYDNIDNISFGKRNDEFDLLYVYNGDCSIDIENKMFSVDKGLTTNRYFANFYVDLTGMDIDLTKATVIFRLMVPNGTISNNASHVSNNQNELTWNINYLGKTEIDFDFELKSYDYIYYGVAVLILIVLIFSIIDNLIPKREEKKETISENLTNNKELENKNDNLHKKVDNNIKIVEKENVAVLNDFNINGKSVVNLDGVQGNVINQSNFANKADSIRNLVPEVEISNLQTPVTETKKGLFGKKKKNDNNNIDVSYEKNNGDSFSLMVEKINNEQFGTNVINVNSQVTSLSNKTEYTEKNSLTDELNIPYVNDSDDNIVNVEKENNVVKLNSSNLDINNIPLSITSIDSFQYDEDVVEKNNEIKEENIVVDNDAPVIRVNSKDVIINNKED